MTILWSTTTNMFQLMDKKSSCWKVKKHKCCIISTSVKILMSFTGAASCPLKTRWSLEMVKASQMKKHWQRLTRFRSCFCYQTTLSWGMSLTSTPSMSRFHRARRPLICRIIFILLLSYMKCKSNITMEKDGMIPKSKHEWKSKAFGSKDGSQRYTMTLSTWPSRKSRKNKKTELIKTWRFQFTLKSQYSQWKRINLRRSLWTKVKPLKSWHKDDVLGSSRNPSKSFGTNCKRIIWTKNMFTFLVETSWCNLSFQKGSKIVSIPSTWSKVWMKAETSLPRALSSRSSQAYTQWKSTICTWWPETCKDHSLSYGASIGSRRSLLHR